MKPPQASVIVPTRNRSRVLRACLASLTRQTAPPGSFEVIVVDNGSSDDTSAVARAFDGALRLRLLHESEPGLHVGRHAGWRAAASDVLMFCDDDVEAMPGWVEAVVAAFADPEVALVGGNNLPAFEQTPPSWLRHGWERPVVVGGIIGRALGALSILDAGTGRRDIDPAWVWGCNFNVRSAALEASGGFHPDGLPRERLRFRGDGEMHVGRVVRERGARTYFDSAASVHHRVEAVRMTQQYFELRAFAQGVSDSYAAVRARGGIGFDVAAPLKRWLADTRDHARIAASSVLWRHSRAHAAAATEWYSVAIASRRAHARGVAFHRRELRADQALLAWVQKENYL